MNSMMVEITWGESLGEHWMNLDSLKSCLFTKICMGEGLLTVEEIKHEKEQTVDEDIKTISEIEFFIQSTLVRMNKTDSKQIAAIEHLENALQSLSE